MNELYESYFQPEFILDYISSETGKRRFLTYTLFRFLSAAGKTDETLPFRLEECLPHACGVRDFSVIEDFLAEDYYFSPVFGQDTFDLIFLYDALLIINDTSQNSRRAAEKLIADICPDAAGLSDSPECLLLSSVPVAEPVFYAALYLTATHYEASFAVLLPQFAKVCRNEFSFTCRDFLLFDFMDEYFEQKNCRQHPSFMELTDTLVAAVLNYYHTDFGTLFETDAASYRTGSASRFAGTNRFGAIRLSSPANRDRACHMLAGQFRYAAVYELRNNLFDYHLDDDKRITLENWKEKLRWHFVQYSNVYEMALDSYLTASLSIELLKKQFKENCLILEAYPLHK